jgi:pimeloyl-ACP methyl ester carboxylesterase
MRFIYLHGFASSPSSRKAQAFLSAFAAKGITLEIPTLDQGNFESLTIVGQRSVIEDTLGGEPACLIGSSMGGYLAALYALDHPEIQKLVLLAPAFGFARRWAEKARQTYVDDPPEFFEVYHYGEKRMRHVNSRLITDALDLPPAPDFQQPALIFHGIHDDTAPIENSRSFNAAHPNTRLMELNSDHELLDVLDPITEQAIEFLLADPTH